MIDVYAIKSSIGKLLVSLTHSKNTREIIEGFNLFQNSYQTLKKDCKSFFFWNNISKMQFKLIINFFIRRMFISNFLINVSFFVIFHEFSWTNFKCCTPLMATSFNLKVYFKATLINHISKTMKHFSLNHKFFLKLIN